jgi:hypothetical protein
LEHRRALSSSGTGICTSELQILRNAGGKIDGFGPIFRLTLSSDASLGALLRPKDTDPSIVSRFSRCRLNMVHSTMLLMHPRCQSSVAGSAENPVNFITYDAAMESFDGKLSETAEWSLTYLIQPIMEHIGKETGRALHIVGDMDVLHGILIDAVQRKRIGQGLLDALTDGDNGGIDLVDFNNADMLEIYGLTYEDVAKINQIIREEGNLAATNKIGERQLAIVPFAFAEAFKLIDYGRSLLTGSAVESREHPF